MTPPVFQSRRMVHLSHKSLPPQTAGAIAAHNPQAERVGHEVDIRSELTTSPTRQPGRSYCSVLRMFYCRCGRRASNNLSTCQPYPLLSLRSHFCFVISICNGHQQTTDSTLLLLLLRLSLPSSLWTPAQRKRASMLYFANVYLFFFMAALFSGPG